MSQSAHQNFRRCLCVGVSPEKSDGSRRAGEARDPGSGRRRASGRRLEQLSRRQESGARTQVRRAVSLVEVALLGAFAEE